MGETGKSADDAPLLVLLHGATLNGHMWDGVRRHLTKPWRIIAPDLPGHGAQAMTPYSVPAAIAVVQAAIKASGARRVLLAGDSLGGYSSLAIAATLPPGQLAGLMLSGCSRNISGSMLLQLRMRWWFSLALFKLVGEEKLVDKLVRKELLQAGQNADDVQALIDARIRLRAFGSAVEGLAHVDFLGMLPAIEAPVLIVNGSRDPAALQGEADFLLAARHSRRYRFEGSKHGVSLYRSAEFARVLEEFAIEVQATPGAAESAVA